MPQVEEVNPLVVWRRKQWKHNSAFDFDIAQPKKLNRILTRRMAYALMRKDLQLQASDTPAIPPEY